MSVTSEGLVIYQVVFESKKKQRFTRLIGGEYEMSDDQIGECLVLGGITPDTLRGRVDHSV